MVDETGTPRRHGRAYVGTSGFAYRGWAPLFYPAGMPASRALREYASRLFACELNNTFYRHPSTSAIARWVAATPSSFRFAVKAQRGGSMRALLADPETTVPWLTAPYRLFGERLGSVLLRVPEHVQRDDDRLRALLRAWPADLPLTLEFQHASWWDDEVFDLLRARGAALCTTDLDDLVAPPAIRATGPFLYLRLRRTDYSSHDLEAWAARLEPFLAAAVDVFVFFRHDADGTSALRAMGFPQLLRARDLHSS